MKNMILTILLLNSFSFIHPEEPLSQAEREKLTEKTRNEVICSKILYHLYLIESGNSDHLTLTEIQSLKSTELQLNMLCKNFKCTDQKEEMFKHFKIDQRLEALNQKKDVDLSIEELDQKEYLEQESIQRQTYNKYKRLKLEKQLGLTTEELYQLANSWYIESVVLAPDSKN